MTSFLPPDTRIGTVTLRVDSIPHQFRLYEKILGMRVMLEEDDLAVLGAPTRNADGSAGADLPLLTLRSYWESELIPYDATGLYHLAILLPSREDLGALVGKLMDHRWRINGAADHAVSEAIYLEDDDGNGVEVYADRPRESWPRAGNEIAMTTRPLDIGRLLADAEQAGREWDTLPAGSVMGHVHLKAPSLESARRLFVDVMGFDVTASRYPGALFMSAGGYHHHIAANIWGGPNVPPREDDMGLMEFSVVVPDMAVIREIERRAIKRSNGETRPLWVGERLYLQHGDWLSVAVVPDVIIGTPLPVSDE